MTVAEWLSQATVQLTSGNIETARLDAEIILADALSKERTWLFAHPDEPLPDTLATAITAHLQRRTKHEPLAYIRGFKEFYGRNFLVSPDVLIPRPESEVLIELALKCNVKPGDSILDVGTGSGCLGITLQLEIPETKITLLDVSRKALRVAKQNAAQYNVDAFVKEKDLFSLDKYSALPGSPYALIVANLPYVDKTWQRSEETDFEPGTALFSAAGGLWHCINFLAAAGFFLRRGGHIILEADPRQQDELIGYGEKLGYTLWARQDFGLVFLRQATRRAFVSGWRKATLPAKNLRIF